MTPDATPATQPVFAPADDGFHFAQMGDRWWMTETSWFSFCHPERKLGGWLYTMARPNIGTVAGGAWVWDDTAHLPWEVPYSANYTALRLPRDQDLEDIALPTGVSIRVLEPGMSYALGFADGDRCRMDLRFDGVMPPLPLRRAGSPFGSASHFDRVTGELTLLGQRIAIDCLAARDRSWGPRPEHRPKKSASGTRIVERDPAEGWVTRITVDATDEHGRTLHAVGTRLSHIINRHSFIDSNGLIAWTINGHPGHGEDQDMWPVHDWTDFRRSAQAARSVRAG